MTQSKPITWDIFCRVVDNYGDIGVCWRLARQLANEHSLEVRLWVDELAALMHIWPTAIAADQQWLEKVEVRIWREPFVKVEPAGVVIEAFACELPANYLAAMGVKPIAPHWINLEYLSAETWVDEYHGMHSIHPTLGLKKTFFFPGFTPNTGGVIREFGLSAQRDSFNHQQKIQLLSNLGMDIDAPGLLISLFSYENAAVGALLEAWQTSNRPITCLVPAGKILGSINTHLKLALATGDTLVSGSLELRIIPFMQQQDYDRLLWACDINFIRGEDSFVRAQWAAKPFIWHIYPQDEDAHMVKLNAFLARYTAGLDPELAHSSSELWQRWNRQKGCQNAWNQCIERLSEWQLHSKVWEQQLRSQEDMAGKLIQLCKKSL